MSFSRERLCRLIVAALLPVFGVLAEHHHRLDLPCTHSVVTTAEETGHSSGKPLDCAVCRVLHTSTPLGVNQSVVRTLDGHHLVEAENLTLRRLPVAAFSTRGPPRTDLSA